MNRLKSKVILFFSLLISSVCFAQTQYTLSGTVADQNTNESLIGVTISIREANICTATNEYGFYSVSVPEGIYTVEVSYIGYVVLSESVQLVKIPEKTFRCNLRKR